MRRSIFFSNSHSTTFASGRFIVLGGIIGGFFAGWISHDASKVAAAEVWRLASIKWN
ncbi:hypothetical protein [Bordetella ansorpii]|uniref:hypothetical protein n=1 Tax=Bordetella ansorpii TaxID=288768 RepID=UPI0012E7EF29|nr:hypothetical protein [Bordetella ansorpii]